eukprot:scaffold666969_cov97-Prasinocladus_malaysianus.AAC.1
MDAIVRFCCRATGTTGRKQFGAQLADPYAEPNMDWAPDVDVLLRHVASVLLSGEALSKTSKEALASDIASEVTETEKKQLASCLAYLRDRVRAFDCFDLIITLLALMPTIALAIVHQGCLSSLLYLLPTGRLVSPETCPFLQPCSSVRTSTGLSMSLRVSEAALQSNFYQCMNPKPVTSKWRQPVREWPLPRLSF